MSAVTASQGIRGWLQAFDQSASTVSRSVGQLASESPQAQAPAGDDLTDGMVGMRLDAIGIRASVQVIRTQDQMLGTLLDMHA